MTRVWKIRLSLLMVVLIVLMTGYSCFYRNFLDGDRYLSMALEATGNDPTIINADEPDFAIGFHDRRLTIHFVFQTQEKDGIGSISLHIDPFRKTSFDVERRMYYRGLD